MRTLTSLILTLTLSTALFAAPCELEKLDLLGKGEATVKGWKVSAVRDPGRPEPDDPDLLMTLTSPQGKTCQIRQSLLNGFYFAPGKVFLTDGQSGSEQIYAFYDPATCQQKVELRGLDLALGKTGFTRTIDCNDKTCDVESYRLPENCLPKSAGIKKVPIKPLVQPPAASKPLPR